MDVRPEKFDLEFWKDIFRLVSRLAVLAMVVLGGTGAVSEVTTSGLKEQEAKASTHELRASAEAREDFAYEEYYDLLRYHASKDAACDSALESFSRHREDERDWGHVVEECHSEGGIE